MTTSRSRITPSRSEICFATSSTAWTTRRRTGFSKGPSFLPLARSETGPLQGALPSCEGPLSEAPRLPHVCARFGYFPAPHPSGALRSLASKSVGTVAVCPPAGSSRGWATGFCIAPTPDSAACDRRNRSRGHRRPRCNGAEPTPRGGGARLNVLQPQLSGGKGATRRAVREQGRPRPPLEGERRQERFATLSRAALT